MKNKNIINVSCSNDYSIVHTKHKLYFIELFKPISKFESCFQINIDHDNDDDDIIESRDIKIGIKHICCGLWNTIVYTENNEIYISKCSDYQKITDIETTNISHLMNAKFDILGHPKIINIMLIILRIIFLYFYYVINIIIYKQEFAYQNLFFSKYLNFRHNINFNNC